MVYDIKGMWRPGGGAVELSVMDHGHFLLVRKSRKTEREREGRGLEGGAMAL